jgi:hypothetical protein
MKKTFRAWAISDVKNGKRELLIITSNDDSVIGACTIRAKVRHTLDIQKYRHYVSPKARVEKVTITVESE